MPWSASLVSNVPYSLLVHCIQVTSLPLIVLYVYVCLYMSMYFFIVLAAKPIALQGHNKVEVDFDVCFLLS